MVDKPDDIDLQERPQEDTIVFKSANKILPFPAPNPHLQVEIEDDPVVKTTSLKTTPEYAQNTESTTSSEQGSTTSTKTTKRDNNDKNITTTEDKKITTILHQRNLIGQKLQQPKNNKKNNPTKKVKNKKPVVVEIKNQRKITELFKPKLNEQNQSSDSVKTDASKRNATSEIPDIRSPVSKARGHVDVPELPSIELPRSNSNVFNETSPDLGLRKIETFTSKQQLSE